MNPILRAAGVNPNVAFGMMEESNRVNTNQIDTQASGSTFVQFAQEWTSDIINDAVDNKGNAYTAVTLDHSGNPNTFLLYSLKGVGGKGHRFNAQGDGSNVIAVELFGVSSYVGQTTAVASAMPYSSGNLAVLKGDLLLAYYCATDGSGHSTRTNDLYELEKPMIFRDLGASGYWSAQGLAWAIAKADGNVQALFNVGTPALPTSKVTIVAFRP